MGLRAGIHRGKVRYTLNCVQKKAATFPNHMSYLVWEALAQHRKIACILPFFKAYSREWAQKDVGNRLQGPCYVSRDDCDQKIKARKQRTHIGKYSFVNRTIKLWNQLPAEALATFSCRLERVRSPTQLCQLRCFNDYTRQLHVSARTGHLQVVFKRT